MPIYEYECPGCGARFESLQKIGEETAPCPRCGGRSEKVLASSFGVIASGRARPWSECDRSNPCCGRAEPCDDKPCN